MVYASHPGVKFPQKQHIINGNDRLAPVFGDIPFLVVVTPCPRDGKGTVGKLRTFDVFTLGTAKLL